MTSGQGLIGSVLDGKYRVERLLGRGGMGEVYAAKHIQLERPVAIKILRADLSEEDHFVSRFTREARATAKLTHPNVVGVYDFGTLPDGSAYLVMEFIFGTSLRELLRRDGPRPLPEALDLIRQATTAIVAAHARGILHRDVKPDNMMVTSDEAGHIVLKVVDFGLAKVMGSATQLTANVDLLGTPLYLPPEAFSGTEPDARTDVYALGCVFFELLAGRPPFKGRVVELARAHAFQEVPTLASLGAFVPPEVEDVVRHALEKDPDDRTPTAAEFLRKLETIASSAQPTPSEATRVRPEAARPLTERVALDQLASEVTRRREVAPPVASTPTPRRPAPRIVVPFPPPAPTVAQAAGGPSRALIATIAAGAMAVALVAYLLAGRSTAPSTTSPSGAPTNNQAATSSAVPASQSPAKPETAPVSSPEPADVPSSETQPINAPAMGTATPSPQSGGQDPAATAPSSTTTEGGSDEEPSLTGVGPAPQRQNEQRYEPPPPPPPPPGGGPPPRPGMLPPPRNGEPPPRPRRP